MSVETKKEVEEIANKVSAKIQDTLDQLNNGVKKLRQDIEGGVNKAETLTIQHPGAALAVAFLAGLAVGGVIVLAASKKKED
jgi:ElaB/YqjD/DUF883 family membrane-anchored ribosome-binding protein